MLRVVALGLRPVGCLSLSLGHVLPPFILLPFGQTLPHRHDATHRSQVHALEVRRTIAELLLKRFSSLSWRPEVDKMIAPSKCTKKAVVLDCAHFRLERGKGAKPLNIRGRGCVCKYVDRGPGKAG